MLRHIHYNERAMPKLIRWISSSTFSVLLCANYVIQLFNCFHSLYCFQLAPSCPNWIWCMYFFVCWDFLFGGWFQKVFFLSKIPLSYSWVAYQFRLNWNSSLALGWFFTILSLGYVVPWKPSVHDHVSWWIRWCNLLHCLYWFRLLEDL